MPQRDSSIGEQAGKPGVGGTLQAEVLFQFRREKSDADSRLPEFHAQLTS